MEICVYSIQKSVDEKDIKNYISMSKKFANINDIVIFNDKISKAQSINQNVAQKSYEEAYKNHIKGFCIGLDEGGEMMNSFDFAKLLESKNNVSFFIGGAFGFNDEFKSKMDKLFSLTRLTMSHKIAKVVLFEQIYRALSINANHPYHK